MPKVNKEKMEIFNKLRNADIVSKDEYDSLTVKQMKKLWDEYEAKKAEMEKKSQDCIKHAEELEQKIAAEAKAKADAEAKDKAKADRIAERLKKQAAEEVKKQEEKAKVAKEIEKAAAEAQAKAEDQAHQKTIEAEQLAATEAQKHVPQATTAPSQGVITCMPKAAQGFHDCSNCGDTQCRANMEASFTKCIPNACLKWRPEGTPIMIASIPDPKFKERDTVLYKDRILAQVQGSYRFGNTYMYRLIGLSENQTYETIPESELSLQGDKRPEPASIPLPVAPKNQPNVRDCKNCGDAVCGTNMASMFTNVPPNSCIKWMGQRKFQPGMKIKHKDKPGAIATFYMIGRAWGYDLLMDDKTELKGVPEIELTTA